MIHELANIIPRPQVQDTVGTISQQFEILCSLLGDNNTMVDYGMLLAHDNGEYIRETQCLN